MAQKAVTAKTPWPRIAKGQRFPYKGSLWKATSHSVRGSTTFLDVPDVVKVEAVRICPVDAPEWDRNRSPKPAEQFKRETLLISFDEIAP